MRKLNVLIACEESQAECLAFRELGANAFSCDIQMCRPKGFPEWHICQDVTPLLVGSQKRFKTADGKRHQVAKWDLIICHPPCTYLCRVSSVHMVKKTPSGMVINAERYSRMLDAADFFHLCLNANADYVAVENPIPMKRAGLPPPSCFCEPSWFGVKYTKKTLWWLKNLPPIVAQIDHPNPKEFVKASRGKYRSRTFPEVAKGVAAQWYEYIVSQKQ